MKKYIFISFIAVGLLVGFYFVGFQAFGQTPTPTPTVTPAPVKSLTLTFPNGGEQFVIGNTYTIKWENPTSIRNLYVDLYKGGKFFGDLVHFDWTLSLDSGGPTSYDWSVFKVNDIEVPGGGDYKIILRSADGTIYDESDNYFTIVKPTGQYLTVTAPNKEETLINGQSYDITWSYSGIDKVYITLKTCDELSGAFLVKEGIPASIGKYSWKVSPSFLSGNKFKIELSSGFSSDSGSGGIIDRSDNCFTIIEPTPTPTSTPAPPFSLKVFVDASTPGASIIAAGSTGVEFTKYKFSATNEPVIITGLKLANANGGTAGDYDDNFGAVYLSYPKDAADTIEMKTGFFADGSLTFADGQLAIYVPKDGSAVLTIKADTKTIAQGADAGDKPKIGLAKTANQWGAGGTLTNEFIVQGVSSGRKVYGATDGITVDNVNIQAMTIENLPIPVKSLALISPNGGEQWEIGQPYDIKWNKTGSVGNYVRIELYNANGLYMQIFSVAENNGTYHLVIPNYTETGDQYKIKITDNTDTSVYDFSDNYFSIKPVKIIRWCNDSDGGENYYIKGQTEYYDTSTGSGGTGIDSCWNDILSESYCINDQYKAISYQCPYGCQDGACIQQTKFLTITSPNGGEAWGVGKTYEISWSKSGFTDTDKMNIQLVNYEYGLKCSPLTIPIGGDISGYSKCGPFIYKIASDVPINKGVYSWTVPSAISQSKTYKIRIETPITGVAYTDQYKIASSATTIEPYIPPTVYYSDESDNYFGIVKETSTCTDSDGGENYYVAGEVNSVSGSGAFDACDFTSNVNGILKEAVCKDGTPTHVEIACPSDVPYCRYGKCVSAFTSPCTDTDGGRDYYVKGTIKESRIKDGPEHTDYCEDLTTYQPWSFDPTLNNCAGGNSCGLREYYCTEPYQTTTWQDTVCSYGCKDGACVKETSTPTPIPVPTPVTSCGAKEGTFCGGKAGFICCRGLTCELDKNSPDAGGKCVSVPTFPPISQVGCGEQCAAKGYISGVCTNASSCDSYGGPDLGETWDCRSCPFGFISGTKDCVPPGEEVRCCCEKVRPIPEPPSPSPVPYYGFRNAYWQCYDGKESFEGGSTSCKPSEIWQEYANKFCGGHCYSDGSKCGVNTFKVWNECGATPMPTTPVPVPTVTSVPVPTITPEVPVPSSDCVQQCKTSGYKYGTCRSYLVEEGKEKACQAEEANIGQTNDCLVPLGLLGKNTTCCCGKGEIAKEEKVYPNNTIIKSPDSPMVYLTVNDRKLWIPSIKVFNQLKLNWSRIKTLSKAEFDSILDAQLIRATGEAPVYIVSKAGYKRHLPNPEVFESYNFGWSDVVEVDSFWVNSFPNILVLQQEGDYKVYKLEKGLRRWIKTAEAFEKLGYDWPMISTINKTEFNFYQEGTAVE